MSLPSSLTNFLEDPTRSWVTKRYQLRELWRRKTAKLNPQPILIFGNQKSGTSAITALLAEATGLTYTIDILCRYPGLEESLLYDRTNFEEMIARARYYFSKNIIKDPSFTFFYPDLCYRFPQAQRVFVLRDPRHNIRSILNRLQLPGHLEDLSDNHWHIISTRFPAWYPVLDGRAAGHKGSTYIETLARRCRHIFQIYLTNQNEVVPIYYEAFNRHKVHSINRLAEQLGLPIVNSIEPKKDIQFQPKGDTSVTLESFFGPTNLKLIKDTCRPEMIRLGYDV
ncbi:MAG: sulfotransferase [Anaerolineaceae bacterium]|nr:sulfotransferase [Anaerolineaceae bacterium]